MNGGPELRPPAGPAAIGGLGAVASLVLLASVIGGPTRAAAQDEPEPYARVIVDTTPLRSGPSTSYRRVYLAERGEVFPVTGRAPNGYWFKVELPDGTDGWVLGDTVYNHEVSEEEASRGRFLPWLFAPPPLPGATGELAVTFGMIGKTFGFDGAGGFMAVRPTILVNPAFGFEVTAAASVARGGRMLIGAVGGILNVFPESPIVPYVVAGGGYAVSDPNADTYLLQSGSTAVAYGGGGLRFGFRYRLTLRVEARAYAFYQPDLYVAQEELSGGITVFF